MKYLLNYKNGDWCLSKSFEPLVNNDEYIAVNDEDFEALLSTEKILTSDNKIVVNPNPINILRP